MSYDELRGYCLAALMASGLSDVMIDTVMQELNNAYNDMSGNEALAMAEEYGY